MSVLIGHASISENGTINGSKGDSTKKEVFTRTWYGTWDFMAIHPDATVREKHAKAIEAACANDNIGYGQGDRNTLNTLAKAVGYVLSKVGKCNCDCSSLQNVAAVASGAPGVTYGSNGWVTANMKTKLSAAGYKIITDRSYLTSEDYCVRGAIYVKSGVHTVCGLTNGSKAQKTLAKVGFATTTVPAAPGNTSYSGKGIGTAVAKTSINIRAGAATNYKSYGVINKGTAVEVLEVLSSGWYKIVWPGASCGYAYTSNIDGAYYNYTSGKVEKPQSCDKSLAGTYKTTTALYMRAGAGTNKEILLTIPSGGKVKGNGDYSTDGSSKKWLYVEYHGVTGFCSSKYLIK